MAKCNDDLSVSELYEQAQEDRDRSQKDADEWADENNMSEWSNGDPRANYKDETNDDILEEDDLQSEIKKKVDALRGIGEDPEMGDKNDDSIDGLNKRFQDLLDRRQYLINTSTSNVEDRDRNADTIYRIGEEIDRIRKNINKTQ